MLKRRIAPRGALRGTEAKRPGERPDRRAERVREASEAWLSSGNDEDGGPQQPNHPAIALKSGVAVVVVGLLRGEPDETDVEADGKMQRSLR